MSVLYEWCLWCLTFLSYISCGIFSFLSFLYSYSFLGRSMSQPCGSSGSSSLGMGSYGPLAYGPFSGSAASQPSQAYFHGKSREVTFSHKVLYKEYQREKTTRSFIDRYLIHSSCHSFFASFLPYKLEWVSQRISCHLNLISCPVVTLSLQEGQHPLPDTEVISPRHHHLQVITIIIRHHPLLLWHQLLLHPVNLTTHQCIPTVKGPGIMATTRPIHGPNFMLLPDVSMGSMDQRHSTITTLPVQVLLRHISRFKELVSNLFDYFCIEIEITI